MTSETSDNILSLLGSHFQLLETKLSSQTDSLKTTIAKEIEDEISKELELTIRVIDRLNQRLSDIERQLDASERPNIRVTKRTRIEHSKVGKPRKGLKSHSYSRQRGNTNYQEDNMTQASTNPLN